MSSESVNTALRTRLHDGICQHLTAALMFADALRRSLDQRGAAETPDAEKLVEILRDSADELIAIMNIVSERREEHR